MTTTEVKTIYNGRIEEARLELIDRGALEVVDLLNAINRDLALKIQKIKDLEAKLQKVEFGVF